MSSGCVDGQEKKQDKAVPGGKNMKRKKQSKLKREAIDKLNADVQNNKPKTRLKKAKGIWKDRHDLTDIEVLRREWDRR